MRLMIILFFTFLGGFVGWVVPQFLLWIGALIGFVIGVVLAFGAGGGASDGLDFDFGGD